MKLALTRVDSRLVHGQVIEDWVPAVDARVVVVANDDVAADPLQSMIMETCTCSGDVEVKVLPVRDVGPLLQAEPGRGPNAIVLLKDVSDAKRLWETGVHFTRLNLGNVHEHPGSTAVARTVFLNEEDFGALRQLVGGGVDVEIRAVSRDRSQRLEELL